jgi:hypothetical protein
VPPRARFEQATLEVCADGTTGGREQRVVTDRPLRVKAPSRERAGRIDVKDRVAVGSVLFDLLEAVARDKGQFALPAIPHPN